MKLPTRLHLELTNRCNSPCQTCIRTLLPDPERDLSLAEVKRLVDGLPELDSVALQVNGEPLLHPELPDIIRLLVGRGARVELNTNGLLLGGPRAAALIDSGLAGLNVSVEALDPQVYAQLRGVDAQSRVVAGLERFMQLRGPAPAQPRVSLWMTANRRNLGDLPGLVDLAARVGAEEVYLQRLVYFGDLVAREEESLHGRLGAEHRAIIAEAERRAAATGVALRACGRHSPAEMLEAPVDPEVWRTCRRPWDSAVVMANGDVVPCCISTFTAPRADIVLGNALTSSWTEVWEGEPYREQRRRMHEGEPPPHCAKCGGQWSL